MPTIAVNKYDFFEALGQKYTTQEFEDLCFEFGIELDEDTENEERPVVNGVQEPPQLKIEIPANRYDMLCFEGIALMLKIFLDKVPIPKYKFVEPADGNLQSITVTEDTAKVRPLVAGAILRNITFTKENYESFIGLQDKLHQNLARMRTLVSIGTHDLDTVQGPFTYEAHPPKNISFVPLNQSQNMTGEELMQFYETDKHLGRYLHIIRDAPVYPVIYDANKVVCSLPPIINGDHSKITLDTKNVFIEITATDETKLDIVCNIMVAMFSQYCAEPLTIEPVKIVSEHNGMTRLTPSLEPRLFEVEVDYLNSCTGLNESPEAICKLLEKMSHSATPSSKDTNIIEVKVPATRADVLHQCDIMEDVAIAFGFNNLPRMEPNKSATIGQPLAINTLADIVRMEAAVSGWVEVMPLILCSYDENFSWLNREDDGKTAVRIANPKSAEYQVVRTSLLPGLMKTIRENKKHSLPMKLFEVSDVAFKEETIERQARNERHFAAAFCGTTSGFEVVHGLLDRVLLMLEVPFMPDSEGPKNRYWLEEIDEPTFFKGRAAAIFLSLGGKTMRIGEFGVLHPSVPEKFDLKYPVSTLEINLELFI
ncbi:phenylalanyl-tRNA beta subunit [Zalerion maritima]|uniref:Phenylalanine--tRNA ligase beta subunit n=1 Tax=Zalerion maritima TaxID=339359 RepID=A0AAD5S0W7_9PEZI|nr:phenylalanyl-tRNA beta subunit [Zalerion maritima]